MLKSVVEKTPRDAANGGRDVGDNNGHNSTEVGTQRTSSVEPEPPYPEEDCSENNVRNIVWSVIELVCTVATAFAQHERVGQGCAPRRDMYGRSTGEIKATHLGRPSRGIPCPACDGIVDHGRPDKHEDHAGKHATTFGSSADCECNTAEMLVSEKERKTSTTACVRYCRKHALVDGKQEVWDVVARDRRGAENISKADVVEVSDERASRVTEAQRVTPKEPLPFEERQASAR